MRLSKDLSLVLLVIAATVAMALVREARVLGYFSVQTQVQFAFGVFGLNIIAGIIGILWTLHRPVWCAYLALTVICMILFGSSPISTAMILVRLGARHLLVR